MAGDYVDPFEAFKAKKKVENEKKADEAAPKIAPKIDEKDLEGRPKGFATHRFNFGAEKPTEPPKENAPKPKGFDSGRLTPARGDLPHTVDPTTVSKLKGFDDGKIAHFKPTKPEKKDK